MIPSSALSKEEFSGTMSEIMAKISSLIADSENRECKLRLMDIAHLIARICLLSVLKQRTLALFFCWSKKQQCKNGLLLMPLEGEHLFVAFQASKSKVRPNSTVTLGALSLSNPPARLPRSKGSPSIYTNHRTSAGL